MVKIILTRKNEEILVDDADYKELSKRCWYLTSRGHPQGCINGKRVYMHHLLLPKRRDEGIVVDHINGNPCDNRRDNLRYCTYSQNNANAKKNKNGHTSKYKGVSWYKPLNKWTAKAYRNKRQIHLGYFVTEELAAEAYNDAVASIFGEYASLNTITHRKGHIVMSKNEESSP